MAAESPTHLELEIGHVLFMDVVGYSKLLTNEQREIQRQLTQIVRSTEHFRAAERAGKLIRLPVGDGMALVFFNTPEAPVHCALEVANALGAYPHLQLRMGIHSGPVSGVTDVNERSNVAGVGINMAQRVMDCGDAGHILLSSRIADAQEEQRAVDHRAASVSARKWSLIICLLLIVVAAAIAGFWLLSHRVPSKPSAIAVAIPDKSIAVLPLDNLSEEKENAFFADGIQDELLSNLAKIKDLKVISRTSVMPYKAGITRNLKEIAQQLGVSNVVEGSVRRSGNHVRVSVQLIDALTDRHIWAQNYDRTLADSLALQGELATEIAAGVGATLSPQEKARVEATPTKNTAAYDAYLRGRALAAGLTTDFSNVESAARSFQESVTLDPNFALAWAYLSSALSSAYWNGIDSTPTRLAAAKDAADRAVALDPNLPVQRRFGHWDETIAVIRHVIALDPRNTEAAGILALSYMAKRQFPDALAVLDHILAFDPSNRQAIEIKAFCLWAMRDFEAADLLLTRPDISLHLRGHQAITKGHYAAAADFFSKALKDAHGGEKREILVDLGLAQQRAGNMADAKATFQEAMREVTQELGTVPADSGPAAELHSYLGVVYAALGDAASAVKEGKKGMAMQPSSEDLFEGPAREEQMAQIYALLGNADEAIPIIKRLVHIASFNSISVGLMHIDPVWDPIRSDPRFQELVAEKKPVNPKKF
ncbi:MAG: hypothetical protein DME40_16525 [Verrucomicrobia bacterium]|nr:MAG: hypothetical protein DME40_16525 [Verrucomicrobiota bacterium]